MLQRIKMDEESSSDANSSILSSEGGSTPASELEKLDLSPGPSMSTVFRSSEDGDSGSRPNSRPSSQSRTNSRTDSIFHRRKSSQAGSESDREKKKKAKEDHMCRWLQAGNVIYKSVGLGLMDLTIGMKVIEFAKQKGVGTHVDGF